MLSFGQYLEEGARALAQHYIRAQDASPHDPVVHDITHHPELGRIPTFYRVSREREPGEVGGEWHRPQTIPFIVGDFKGSSQPDRIHGGGIKIFPGAHHSTLSHEMRHGSAETSRIFKGYVDSLEKHDDTFRELMGAHRINPSERTKAEIVRHIATFQSGEWQDPHHPLHQHFSGVNDKLKTHYHTVRKSQEGLPQGVLGGIDTVIGQIEKINPENAPHVIQLAKKVVNPLIAHYTKGKALYHYPDDSGIPQLTHPKLEELLGTVATNNQFEPKVAYNLSQSEAPTTHADLVHHIGRELSGFKSASHDYNTGVGDQHTWAHNRLLHAVDKTGNSGILAQHLDRFHLTGDAEHLRNAAQVLRHSFVSHSAAGAEDTAEFLWQRGPRTVDRHTVRPLRRHIDSAELSPAVQARLHSHLDRFEAGHQTYHRRRMRDATAAGHLLATHHYGFEPAALSLLHRMGNIRTMTPLHQDALTKTIQGFEASRTNLADTK